MVAIIEIEGLRKAYRGRHGTAQQALAGFDMIVQEGQVHGFLGPNGSGKTTTLRALVGLVRADAGSMRLLGRTVPDALPQVTAQIGAIVEGAAFFPHFTARCTLEILARIGDIPRRRVEDVLGTVGLTDRADDRIATFSLGMKQRLAVATALLKSPRLLILDEPANGLDPAGIREMRDLMRRLAADGVTVVLSSHILGEVQQICDSVTIIARGRRVAGGAVADVVADQHTGDFRVRVADRVRAAGVLVAAGASVRTVDDHLIVSGAPDPEWVNSTLGQHNLWAGEIVALTPDLEGVFLRLAEDAS